MKNNDKLKCFDHVAVLMLENRSFDNILGYLSTSVDGVIGKKLSNPAPIGSNEKPVHGADKGPIPVSPGRVMDNPNPDPGEYFPHVNTQLYGKAVPSCNAYVKKCKNFDPPYNQPADDGIKTVPCYDLPYPAPMNGFVQDYYNKWVATHWLDREPTRDEYSVIMNCFPPDRVPIMSGLANNFAVFDKWHCAVPSQTFCNRSFFNAATSHGQVVNTPYPKWLGEKSNNETIFNRLENLGKPWVIYYDKEDVFPLTLLIHFKKLWQFFKHHKSRKLHFRHMEDFYNDVAHGQLPAYAFVEPRLFLNHNDMHPPIKIVGITQKSTVTAGEHLVNDVYNAIRNSGSPDDGHTDPNGSHSENTLLTITYDEHGGCYDHVSPPQCATPPGDGTKPEMGFGFDRLGIRVPTIMISAWIAPQVVNKQMQHTSMLKTLSKKWEFNTLTNRDANAPCFSGVFNRDSPLPGKEWQEFKPIDYAPKTEENNNLAYPLSDLQQAIFETVQAINNDTKDKVSDEDLTVGKAIHLMRKKLEEVTID